MKKHNYLSKALSLALMLVMLVSLASIGVSAEGNLVIAPDGEFPLLTIFLPYENDHMTGTGDFTWIENDYTQDVVISCADFEKYIQPYANEHNDHPFRDTTLELAGVKLADVPGDFTENLQDTVVIESMPALNASDAEWEAWFDAFFDVHGYDENGDLCASPKTVIMTYMFHRHDLAGSQMYFDDNYHWQLCTECANRVYLANHTDKDNDGKCDFCGNAIRYYNVTVKETTGGKVTLSANKGAMNGKISVTVTPDAGYHLEALNFVNANAAHSKRAVWEDTPNAEYHFFIANWDVEVEAIFVKD